MERDDVVLVIDDDPAVTRTLRDFIAAEGHAVAVAHTGAAGLQRIREGDVGLVLLDLLLPDTKGTDVMREALRDPAPPEFIIVTGRGKTPMEDHFDVSFELEKLLQERGKPELLKEMRAISEMARVSYVRQREALGLGHAVLQARDCVGDEPFAVMLSDDIIDS